MTGSGVSVVVCTRNRSRIARAKAQWALSQKACTEAVFVVDGADDDTVPVLRALAGTDARLRVLALPVRGGLPAARNAGVGAATGEWILLMDDDDIPSAGFLDALLAVAAEAEADIVGTPWFNLTGGQNPDEFIRRAPRRRGGPALDRPGFFPVADWEPSLWFTVNALFRRTVFDAVAFDRGYRGNHYREDTDLLVSAARAGYRVVVTSLAYTYLRVRVGGGVERGSRLRYEYWVLRNNWRFLRKHGAWLRREGWIRSPLREHAGLVARRARPLVHAAARRLTGGRRP